MWAAPNDRRVCTMVPPGLGNMVVWVDCHGESERARAREGDCRGGECFCGLVPSWNDDRPANQPTPVRQRRSSPFFALLVVSSLGLRRHPLRIVWFAAEDVSYSVLDPSSFFPFFLFFGLFCPFLVFLVFSLSFRSDDTPTTGLPHGNRQKTPSRLLRGSSGLNESNPTGHPLDKIS